MAVSSGTRAAETRSTSHTRRAKADVTAPGQRFLLLRTANNLREVELIFRENNTKGTKMKKILKLDSSYQVIDGEGVEVLDTMPNGIYEMKFSEMRGIWFESADLEPFNGKVYGDQARMTAKVLRKYDETVGRNLGVLVSGHKGTGKSLFVRNLAVSLSDHIPVIIIKRNLGPMMLSTLASVKGRCVLVFDEFEKMFRGKSDGNGSINVTEENDIREQEKALSFFDGVEVKQEKLILLTVNDAHSLSKYLLGRPGRIYYHFVMALPSPDEIHEYLMDNLKPEMSTSEDFVDKLTARLAVRSVSWDSISAVVSEVNSGETVDDTLNDLNIGTDMQSYEKLKFTAMFSDGEKSVYCVQMNPGDRTVKMTFCRAIDQRKFDGHDDMWTTVRVNVVDIVPDRTGVYKIAVFEQGPGEDENDKPISGAPTIVELTASRAWGVDYAYSRESLLL